MGPVWQFMGLTLAAVVLGLLVGIVKLSFGPDEATQQLPGQKPDPKHALHRQEIQLLVLGLIFVLFMVIWRVAR
ncbi:MAG: hypothetical protein ACM3ZT_03640 [Bacillota bacterium]